MLSSRLDVVPTIDITELLVAGPTNIGARATPTPPFASGASVVVPVTGTAWLVAVVPPVRTTITGAMVVAVVPVDPVVVPEVVVVVVPEELDHVLGPPRAEHFAASAFVAGFIAALFAVRAPIVPLVVRPMWATMMSAPAAVSRRAWSGSKA